MSTDEVWSARLHEKKIARAESPASGVELINAYERLRAAVLGAELIASSGLATMRREGMAAWVKAAHKMPAFPPSMSAMLRPPGPADSAKNELTVLLASLVVTLSAETASA